MTGVKVGKGQHLPMDNSVVHQDHCLTCLSLDHTQSDCPEHQGSKEDQTSKVRHIHVTTQCFNSQGSHLPVMPPLNVLQTTSVFYLGTQREVTITL